MVAWLDSFLQAVGPAAYVILFLAALVEYVVPPFPGDTITLLGGVYAVRGEKSWVLVFAVVTLGSVVGSAIDYFVGMRVARRVREGRPTPGFTPERLASLAQRVGKMGPWLVVGNRFMPGLRSLVFFGAGAFGVSFWRVILLGALSAAAWNVLLMALGIALGGNAERLQAWVSSYNSVVYVGLGFIAVAVAARFALRRWRASSQAVSKGR